MWPDTQHFSAIPWRGVKRYHHRLSTYEFITLAGTPRRRPPPPKANKLELNLRNIEEKNYIKYLGIYIDKNLNWAPHIQHINSKISKNLGILFRLRHFLTLTTLKQIYYSLIYPYLLHGIMSWGNTYPSRWTKVQTKQNKCIRCIFFSHNGESSAPYLKP